MTLAIGVRLARRHHAADDAALDGELAAAEHELQAAVAELRELAHGLFPAALDEEGLAAAIEVLAEHEPRLAPGAAARRALRAADRIGRLLPRRRGAATGARGDVHVGRPPR